MDSRFAGRNVVLHAILACSAAAEAPITWLLLVCVVAMQQDDVADRWGGGGLVVIHKSEHPEHCDLPLRGI
jgi:hypothetical protein